LRHLLCLLTRRGPRESIQAIWIPRTFVDASRTSLPSEAELDSQQKKREPKKAKVTNNNVKPASSTSQSASFSWSESFENGDAQLSPTELLTEFLQRVCGDDQHAFTKLTQSSTSTTPSPLESLVAADLDSTDLLQFSQIQTRRQQSCSQKESGSKSVTSWR
jgi:hypothetical protein